MEELVELSDVIAIGTVGAEELARELIDIPHSYTEEELAEIESLGSSLVYLYSFFHNFSVEEVLKGSVETDIPLHNYATDRGILVDSPAATPGIRLLLFLQEDGGKWYSAKSYDIYYYTVSSQNGIFDLEGDLAFPRSTFPFRHDDGFIRDDTARPYFHLSKIRASINEYKGDLSE